MNKLPAAKNRRVLVIDDNRAIHDDFRKILSPAAVLAAALDATEAALFGHSAPAVPQTQFEVDSAYQGAEGALRVAKALESGRPYALAFVDVRMPPGWDGVETTRKLWELDPSLQVVLCTAYSDYSWGEMFEKLGRRDGLLILKKPFDVVEAFQLAHALTEKWWLHHEARQKMEELESLVAERTRELQQTNDALQTEVGERERAQSFLNSVVENLPIAVFIKEAKELRFVLWNKAGEKLTGIPNAEMIGKTDHDFFPQQDAELYVANDRAAFEKRGVLEIPEEVIQTRNHGARIIHVWKVPIFDAAGRPTFLLGISEDITERKRAEEALRESEDRYRFLVEESPDAIGIYQDGKLVFLNATGARQMGAKTQAELLGRKSEQIIHPDDLADSIDRVQRRLAGETGLYPAEVRYLRLDGTTVPVEVSAAPVTFDGKPAIQFIARDITERRRAEAVQETLLSLAARLSEARTPKDVAKSIFTVAERLWQWDAGTFDRWSVTDGKAQTIMCLDRVGGERREVPPIDTLGVPTSLMRRILTQGAELILRPHSTLPAPAFTRFGDTSHPSAALMYVLIRRQGHPVGILSLQSYTPDAFTEGDLQTFQGLADHCGGALERIQAEELLRESEERFSSAFELAPIGVALIAPDGHWIKVNRALCELVGYSEAELLARTFQDITHPDDLESDLENVRRLTAGEIRSYQLEKRYIHKRGHFVTVLLDVSLVRDGQGEPRYFIGQIQDITERKRNEVSTVAFSQLSQRLSSASSAREAFDIIKEVSQELFGWDAFRIRLYSEQDDSFYSGFTVDTIGGQPVAEEQNEPVKPGELYRRIMARGGELILRDQPPAFGPDMVPFGDLSRPSAVLMFVPIRSRGHVVGMLSIQSYTSNAYNEQHLQALQTMADQCGGAIERIWADEALRKSEAQLFQSQKLETVGKLAGGVAHEFNSLLTVIIGQSELLLGDLPAGSPLAKNVTEISDAASRATTLTRQLLAYGRKQFLKPETLDLNLVIAGMAAMVRHAVGGAVDTQILPAPALPAVKADAGQIEQVVMNLAINARDAMPNGGKLTLETANISIGEDSGGNDPELKPGDYVMLAVTDTGTGMGTEVKARAFEPFFSTKGVGHGTGLGLSTSYGIIKQSGGHISVHSEPGRGTTFKIYLPQAAPEPRTPIPRPGPLGLPRGTETILLVEHDPTLREMAATLLSRLGYTVSEAADGIEALRLKPEAGRSHFDLLLTNVVMPHMGGKELADRVQARSPDTRILFSSAYTENAIVHQGVLSEGVAVLQKPFTPSALAHKVREVLDRREALKLRPQSKRRALRKSRMG